ncbi:MAG TPA: GNAT family N-acetyltransferase [Spirochaetota bacterium]|nr:GNAT family N-acetyltransferase [Spirochaetota bacterium]HPC42052.1 GNAT family N-acetyltransferase [Spirochaetota bacterium]HPL18168.1 GNAT family N-acetyltransferase [Spirochaetota bacterium]HQF09568.1 GNAT family N-acetyltransferase [Spirochaetota bacterium]HQH98362.1 GNAT family N-acetyltransferase [Spirochaetota bacterium]
MAGPVEEWKKKYPKKFAPEEDIFSRIQRGDRIFISTGCGEPQYLVQALTRYVGSNPRAFAEAQVMHVWTLGVAPYADQQFDYNFRHNSFFIGDNTRNSVNTGLADYTPIFLSNVPGLMRSGRIHIDVALIQTSLPDLNGFVSLGVSVDISKAAIEKASIIIAQINEKMPRVHGDSFINIKDIDFIIHHDEDLLEYSPKVPGNTGQEIGKYVSRIVSDGDTIQLGYGSLPNAILYNLKEKRHLGVHTELLTDSMVEFMKEGIIDNSRKSIDRGKTVASFCMGTRPTYEFIHDNPLIDFRSIDFTNNPTIIAGIDNMVAINSALQVDLTGQATAESIGSTFYSGIGGSADFMRGSVLSRGGKSILVVQSTARDGEVSRIVPFLETGTGVTLNRGDIHYIVTEFGSCYIHGKNIRERAMDLIGIAHPRFRPWLIEEAKRLNLIYHDQAFIPGEKGEYPEHLETTRRTRSGVKLFLRPVKISDEDLVKDFFYSMSDKSLQRRFMTVHKDIPHKMRQKFVVIDYTKEMVILACIFKNDMEIIVGIGQYVKWHDKNYADVAFAVRDDYQKKGIGTELLDYITLLAKNEGLQGFTADVLGENKPMLHLFDKMRYHVEKKIEDGVYEYTITFEAGNGNT